MVFLTLRAKHYEKDTSDAQLRENLDLLEEHRGTHTGTHIQKAEVSDPTRTRGKLAPTWEGPYQVVKMVREGTCILANLDSKQLPRT
ncbi:hypothetical protein B296_00025782 [Ensete ventricosum]|uniref:Integrase zinc-binding domain-containing protein n=1 Tax=Ensete ventricosum TaxID=4639 RepID=A0A426XNP8_ENSVE|nr:hypothetical protein B296_00025782 [Ensete ventricosum]